MVKWDFETVVTLHRDTKKSDNLRIVMQRDGYPNGNIRSRFSGKLETDMKSSDSIMSSIKGKPNSKCHVGLSYGMLTSSVEVDGNAVLYGIASKDRTLPNQDFVKAAAQIFNRNAVFVPSFENSFNGTLDLLVLDNTKQTGFVTNNFIATHDRLGTDLTYCAENAATFGFAKGAGYVNLHGESNDAIARLPISYMSGAIVFSEYNDTREITAKEFEFFHKVLRAFNILGEFPKLDGLKVDLDAMYLISKGKKGMGTYNLCLREKESAYSSPVLYFDSVTPLQFSNLLGAINAAGLSVYEGAGKCADIRVPFVVAQKEGIDYWRQFRKGKYEMLKDVKKEVIDISY